MEHYIMKNITTHTGILTITGRLPRSTNGNPRYTFCIDGVNAKTAVDSSYSHEVPNYDGKTVTVTIGSHYGAATLNTIIKGDEK